MNQMKFRKIASIFLAAAMTCGMMSVMSASAEGETEEEYSRRVDFSGLLDGCSGENDKLEKGEEQTHSGCLSI